MTELQIAAESGLCAELNGRILAEKKSTELLAIGQLDKFVILYESLAAIRSHDLAFNAPIIVSDAAHSFSEKDPSAKIKLSTGELLSVKQAIEILMILSDKTAAFLLINTVFGNDHNWRCETSHFFEQLKIKDDFFTVSDQNDDDQLIQNSHMTARSLLKILNKLFNDFPEMLELAKQPELVFQSDRQAIKIKNPNVFLNDADLVTISIANGAKEDDLVAFFKMNQKQYLLELLGLESSQLRDRDTRYTQMKELFSQVRDQLWQK